MVVTMSHGGFEADQMHAHFGECSISVIELLDNKK